MKIVLPLPPTDNHIYGMKGKIRFMYNEAREWKEDAYWLIKEQYKGSIRKGEINGLIITFYLKRWRDIQGSLKLLFDAMEGIVYENDRQVASFYVSKKKVSKNPRVEIELL